MLWQLQKKKNTMRKKQNSFKEKHSLEKDTTYLTDVVLEKSKRAQASKMLTWKQNASRPVTELLCFWPVVKVAFLVHVLFF